MISPCTCSPPVRTAHIWKRTVSGSTATSSTRWCSTMGWRSRRRDPAADANASGGVPTIRRREWKEDGGHGARAPLPTLRYSPVSCRTVSDGSGGDPERPAKQPEMRLPCLEGDCQRCQRPEHRILIAAGVPGPAEAFDDLERIHRDGEHRKSTERGEAGANAEHQRHAGGGLGARGDINPELGRVKTCLGKKTRGSRGRRAGREFSGDMRKHEQPANDANDVQAIGQIEILGLNPEVISSEQHGAILSLRVRCP